MIKLYAAMHCERCDTWWPFMGMHPEPGPDCGPDDIVIRGASASVEPRQFGEDDEDE